MCIARLRSKCNALDEVGFRDGDVKMMICYSAVTLTLEDVASLKHFTRDQIKLTMFLGSGAFGEVFEGVATNILSENSGCTKVAVKVGYKHVFYYLVHRESKNRQLGSLA